MKLISKFLNNYKIVILITLVWIVGLNLLAYFASKIIPMSGIISDRRFSTVDHWFWYDAGFYLGIATSGYHTLHDPAVWGNNFVRAAFFPAFPILGKIIFSITKHLEIDIRTTLLMVNSLLTIGISIFLFKIAEIIRNKEYALKTVIYFLIFPFSFFLICPYSEAILAFFTAGFFYYLIKKNYFVASLFAAGASASRFVGVIFPVILICYYLEENQWKIKKINPKIILISLIPFAGLFAYMFYQHLVFNDWLYFYKMQKVWRSHFDINIFSTVWHNFLEIFQHDIFNYRRFNEVGSIILFTILGVITFFKIKKSFGIFIFLSIAIPLLTQSVDSFNRFVVPMIPAFLALGFISKNKVLEFAYVFISILFLALYTIMFTHSMWVA